VFKSYLVVISFKTQDILEMYVLKALIALLIHNVSMVYAQMLFLSTEAVLVLAQEDALQDSFAIQLLLYVRTFILLVLIVFSLEVLANADIQHNVYQLIYFQE